jgi:subtilisin family serine protease
LRTWGAGVLAGALLSAIAVAPASSAPAGGPPGRYIVVLRDGAGDPAAVAADHGRRYGASAPSFVYRAALQGYAATVPAERLDDLRSDPRVAFVSDDRPVSALDTVPTGIDRVDAEPATSPAPDAAGPAVAVIDTGSGPHPDLNVVGGKNCSTGSSYNDGNGHGTHVAGTVAARNNGAGVVGVLPGAPVWSVRVLDNSGSGSWSSVICGIDWVTANAATLGIKVANMSLGGSGSDDGACGTRNADALHAAICRSVAAGVTYVVAAGNSGVDFKGSVPAAYDEVLTVTAMSDSDGQPGGTGPAPACRTSEGDDRYASFSNFAVSSADAAHTIAAPGVCITSTWPGGGTATISGTSMTTPHVAGTAARCIATGACAGLSPSQMAAKLRADAAARPASYGFTGDPNSPVTTKRGRTTVTRYYGYLTWAGGY